MSDSRVVVRLFADSDPFADAMRQSAEVFKRFAKIWTDPRFQKALRRYQRHQLRIERQLRIRDRRARRRRPSRPPSSP